jgi:hypothetical protein
MADMTSTETSTATSGAVGAAVPTVEDTGTATFAEPVVTVTSQPAEPAETVTDETIGTYAGPGFDESEAEVPDEAGDVIADIEGDFFSTSTAARVGYNVDVLGLDVGAGVDVGLKIEAGLQLGDTTHVDLPLLSVDVPTPMIGWTSEAVMDLLTNPVDTVTGAAEDVAETADEAWETAEDVVDVAGEAAESVGEAAAEVLDFGSDAADAAGSVVEDVGDVLDDLNPF